MSVEVVEKRIRIAGVDVDESMKENVVHEISGYSGVEVSDTGSPDLEAPSEDLCPTGNSHANSSLNSDCNTSQTSGSPLPSDSVLKNDNIVNIVSTETHLLVCKTNDSETNQNVALTNEVSCKDSIQDIVAKDEQQIQLPEVDKTNLELGNDKEENDKKAHLEISKNSSCNGVDTIINDNNSTEIKDTEQNNCPDKLVQSSTQPDNPIEVTPSDILNAKTINSDDNIENDHTKAFNNISRNEADTKTDFNITSKTLTMSNKLQSNKQLNAIETALTDVKTVKTTNNNDRCEDDQIKSSNNISKYKDELIITGITNNNDNISEDNQAKDYKDISKGEGDARTDFNNFSKTEGNAKTDFNDISKGEGDTKTDFSNISKNEGNTKTDFNNISKNEGDTKTDFNNISKNEGDTKTDFNITSKALTMSTTSLNDQIPSNSINNSKSPYSKSAEDISTLDNTDPSSTDSSKTDLNTEQILTEFSNQKIKVKATQKIVNDTNLNTNLTHNIDLRYARIPKEILSQDLGSIAKSVHGIFSSVSGSLKYAYNHSQRTKPATKPVRPVNGKVINEIFEDNVPEATSELTIDNVTEKDSGLNIEEGREMVEDESKKDLMKLQIESLERVLAEQRRENSSLRERVKQQVDELQAKDQAFKELEVRVDLMCKRAEQAQKEKDAAVMRYASVECAAIEARRAAEAATSRERAAAAETHLLNNKLRSARDERERLAHMYDDKCHELKTTEAEVAKLREELRELDGRLKWTQSKLRVEMDAYKESSERAEKLSQQVSELEAARDTATANATDSAKAKQFEAELKESQAALILCRHEKAELERRCSLVSTQLDTCKRERDNANEALATANAQVQKLKESNLRLEEEAAELAALRAQAALADTLSSQLQRETERAAQAEEALTEQMARAETCLRREAAALEHAARLTAQHVAARANCADNDAKAQALAADNASLRERITSLEQECNKLRTALEDETERRNKENRVLARKVAELTEEAAEATKKLEWEKGENSVLKKKHASAIKELNRELQRAMKRVEQLEAKLPTPGTGDAASTRTGSITSLSSGESGHDDRLHNGHTESLPDVQTGPLPERQALIERIVSLQRAAARRAERCEFLEEHSRHLTEELRGKTKLLRHLLPTLPAGALASNHSDAHKKEIARLGGGAMAALWGGETAGMTPELAIEVSARLQAVLEDTLLKNITLKENIDTLGEEIARLRKQANSSNDSK